MKRIAFLGRGGHTLPTYRALLNRVSEHYELTVYSEVPIEKEWLALEHKYSLRAVTTRKVPRRFRELLLLYVLIKDHLNNPYHLVHAHSTYPTGFVAVILQKLFRLRAIVSLHAAEASAFPDINFGDLLHPKRAKINRWVIKNAHIVTALTEFQRDAVVGNLEITRPIKVLHRGVDLNRFYFKRANGRHSPVVILSVGYLNAIKDPETLLRAFHAIQKEMESVLIVVGKDYTDGAFERLAKDLGISGKVRFEGYVCHDVMDAYYQRADLLLHTSRYESQGMVIAEALASGVLVAGTNVGLMSDLSAECCVTVPTGDAEALSQAVLRLFYDQKEMDRLRENGYQWSREHSLDVCSEELVRLYKHNIRAT